MERNRWAEPGLLKPCIFRSRRRVDVEGFPVRPSGDALERPVRGDELAILFLGGAERRLQDVLEPHALDVLEVTALDRVAVHGGPPPRMRQGQKRLSRAAGRERPRTSA